MARVTVEDCKKYLANRFELVILAAQRAKDISLGLPTFVQKGKDKDAVLALREIAAGTIDCDKLRELVISKQNDIAPNSRKHARNKNAMDEIFKELAVNVSNSNDDITDGYEHDEDYDDDCCEIVAQEAMEIYNDDDDDIEEPKHTSVDISKELNLNVTYDDVED